MTEFINENDYGMLIGMVVVVILVFIINTIVKKCSSKMMSNWKSASTNLKIGIIGDVKGYEKNATKVIDNCFNTFVTIGGNTMKTNVSLKISSNKQLVNVIKPLAKKYNISLIGIAFGEERYLKEEECEKIITVEEYQKAGDESQEMLKNIDQLIYLVSKTNDPISFNEFKQFKGSKIRYDLYNADFTKPSLHENMN